MSRRFKLVRLVDGRTQYMDYIGSFDTIPAGWSFAVVYASVKQRAA